MLVARILIGVLVAVCGVTGVMYLVTKDRRWLSRTWSALKIGLFILLIFVTFFVLERFLLVV
jgi:hypothetical protein